MDKLTLKLFDNDKEICCSEVNKYHIIGGVHGRKEILDKNVRKIGKLFRRRK